MPIKQELEAMNITVLAVLCERAAKSSYVDEATAKTLQQLKQDWAKLEIRGTPSDYKTHQQIEAERAALKARMVESLYPLPAAAFAASK